MSSNGYTKAMNKDSGLRIRIQRDLRDRFLASCRAEDKPAAQVVREFIGVYVARHEAEQESSAMQHSHSRKGLPHDH